MPPGEPRRGETGPEGPACFERLLRRLGSDALRFGDVETGHGAGQEAAGLVARAEAFAGVGGGDVADLAILGCETVADLIAEVLNGLAAAKGGDNGAVEAAVNARVRELCARFPIY